MNLQDLDAYIHDISQSKTPLSSEDLAKRVQTYLSQISTEESSESKTFFDAEKAFYLKDYEKAYDLQKEFSEDERGCFFFFRTAAYYLEEIEDHEQASYYAKKALEVFSGQTPWKKYLEGLANRSETSESLSDDDVEFISVAPKELDDLTDMFQDEGEADEIRNILEENLPEDKVKEEKPSLPQSPYTPPKESTDSLNSPLDKAFFDVQNEEIELVNSYLEQENKPQTNTSTLEILSHCTKSSEASSLASQSETLGYYFTSTDQGVVINPQKGFIEAFHKKGHTLSQVTTIFVTTNHLSNLEELKAIQSWNRQLNRLRDRSHTIEYYLPEKLYQNVLKEFTFYSRQERESIHSLYFFEGSKNNEEIVMSSALKCTYFEGAHENLGLSFEVDQSKTLSFLPQMAWDSSLPSHLKGSDLVVAGIGKTTPEDYSKEKFSTNHLGYNGVDELIKQVAPNLLVVSEFEMNQQSLKWPIYSQLHKEHTHSATNIVLSSNDYQVDLETLGMLQDNESFPIDEMHAVHIGNEIKYVYKLAIL